MHCRWTINNPPPFGRQPGMRCPQRNPRSLACSIGWIVILTVLLSAVGCAPTIDEEVRLAGIGTPRAGPEPKPMPRFAGAGFVAADGQVLPLRKWLPQGEVKAVILALHGFNDYSNS